VDAWYKTEDRASFKYARRLIAEEGILCGGSSGSAMDAAIRAIKDLKLGKDDVVVVVCPDSIRSYLSKFVDDDWLAANDLLPPTADFTAENAPAARDRSGSVKDDAFKGATIADLRLKPVTSISTTSACTEAIETMREKGFDQLPVSSMSASGKPRLVGLVTLGNLLSYMSSGRVSPKSKVEDAMFDFRKLPEVVKDLGRLQLDGQKTGRRREFVEITKNTTLADLNKFFEWNSAAVVTEKVDGELRASAVVTKVDLLTWMVKQQKN